MLWYICHRKKEHPLLHVLVNRFFDGGCKIYELSPKDILACLHQLGVLPVGVTVNQIGHMALEMLIGCADLPHSRGSDRLVFGSFVHARMPDFYCAMFTYCEIASFIRKPLFQAVRAELLQSHP